jgi:type II secretory pathway pseudopilin PulG
MFTNRVVPVQFGFTPGLEVRMGQLRSRGSRVGGFTIVELLVVIGIVALLLALLMPSLAKARDSALTTHSLANLRSLAVANEAYAGDWGDRQFGVCPGDAGLAYGNCQMYLQQVACPPQVFIGRDTFGIWGYFLGSTGKCAQFGWPEACYNWIVYLPLNFGQTYNPGGGNAFGSFRMPGVMTFADSVGGRFYDPTFYAPKDELVLSEIEGYFSSPAQFTFDGERYADSSYCFSPAAMFDPKVLRRNGAGLDGNGFTHPANLPGGFRAPSVARCSYPSLKTRMIEHSWLQNRPDALSNPNFYGGKTPWHFNHGINSAPASLFFDGHVELVGCQRAMQAEQRAGKLWSRNTPLGPLGYYGQYSYDTLVDTSFHILTTDGIEGRDVLGSEG